jgi:hypothetical protein
MFAIRSLAMKPAAATACALALALAGSPLVAKAAVLLDLAGPTPRAASPGSIDRTFHAAQGAGSVTFVVDGYGTLDGAGVSGGLEDIFTLSLNGTPIFSGSFDLGGGGINTVFFMPDGASVTPHSGCFNCGGSTVDVSLTLDLLEGLNTLTFSYASRVPQAPGDEGWGVHGVVVTGEALASAAPEPRTWAMLLLGFFALGATARVQRRRQPALCLSKQA